MDNTVKLSGHVSSRFVAGTTKDGHRACSFLITSESLDGRRVKVRVNAYDELAEICDKFFTRESDCSVVGELMNREGQFGELTEIRAKEVIFSSSQPRSK